MGKNAHTSTVASSSSSSSSSAYADTVYIIARFPDLKMELGLEKREAYAKTIVMFSKFALVLALLVTLAASEDTSFRYNGFLSDAGLGIYGRAEITSNGLLRLTDDSRHRLGQTFYAHPITFATGSSFSTTFVFAIVSQYPTMGGHGLAFVISRTRWFPPGLPSQYFGLFDVENIGNASNHVVVIELDTIQSKEFADINDNHVGIDING
ncbi:L-type lectin-domain containing receptor kinase IV.2 [Morella rubra]|uniref:L-type lectin-domain containing receptor kinase IV.2 n=1 Tax=Morella rubra TaxID=262757 RepID=A0A6A1WDB6_9ROSI|nr:L-type lectin-domain containing receptor kinase IV.2 [Morella rubra]